MPRSSRPTGPHDGADAERRLARLLDGPQLTAIVALLPPETLCRLIRHRGLDQAGPLVASATPEQLAAVLDLDLWRPPRPGLDEQFDGERFGEWMEALVEYDGEQAARVVAALDADMVTAGLSRHIRVFDVAALLPPSLDDFEPLHDPAPEALEREVGGYRLRARVTEAWDAIVRLLTILAGEEPEAFDVLMRGCRRLSDSAPEIDGLDDLLGTAEQLVYDLGVGRDERRRERGYLSPAEARAFLQMARESSRAPRSPVGTPNPIVADYLRSSGSGTATIDPPADGAPRSGGGADAAVVARQVAELLDEVEAERPAPRGFLPRAADDDRRLGRVRGLLERLRDGDPNAYFARSRELAFLANALLSGGALQSRSLTPQEARDAALAACNLGLESLGDAGGTDGDLLAAFEAGWARLFADVSAFVSRALLSTLQALRPSDPDTRMALLRLERELAILERHTGPVSPTAFEFISTTRQVEAVHAFAARLPALLAAATC